MMATRRQPPNEHRRDVLWHIIVMLIVVGFVAASHYFLRLSIVDKQGEIDARVTVLERQAEAVLGELRGVNHALEEISTKIPTPPAAR
jgi:hypothetical protein